MKPRATRNTHRMLAMSAFGVVFQIIYTVYIIYTVEVLIQVFSHIVARSLTWARCPI